MAEAADGQGAVATQEGARAALRELDQLLESSCLDELAVCARAGEPIPLPAQAARLLREAVHQLARGREVRIATGDSLLTTTQAAALLNVSRPYLVRLLKQGEMQYEQIGTHRRVRYEDLLAYKQRRDAARRAALA